MQASPLAQRVLSGASCSTSSTPSYDLAPRSCRLQARAEPVHCADHSCSHHIGHKLSSRALQHTVLLIRKRKLKGRLSSQAAPSVTADVSSLNSAESRIVTKYVAETCLPTKTGKYRVRAYRHSIDGDTTFTEPTCIMTGKPEGQENVVVRVHDACFTSEVLGSLKCDCAEQLQLAMEYIQERGTGIIIYLQQEGRGIGLSNKIAAYSLQERGLDTVDANRALGLPDDCREYTSVKNILADLHIKSIQLMTNNPRKIESLRAIGVRVTDRVPCIVQGQEYSQNYLDIKQAKMAHDFDGSYCYWDHDGSDVLPGTKLPADPHESSLDQAANGS